MPNSRSGSARLRRFGLWAVLLLLAILAVAYWYGVKPATKAPTQSGAMMAGGPGRGMAGMAVPIRVAPVEAGTINSVFPAVGTVTAFNTVNVRSRVEGELTELLFDDGQAVEQGDLLAVIDPRPYQVQLDQALGQQQQNQAQLANAQRDLQRYQTLFKQNSIARQQVDAQAALVQQYEGRALSDQAAVDNARLQLAYTQITAPISGRLGLRKVDVGNLVSGAGTEGLVVITQTRPIAVTFSLPQARLAAVQAQLREGKTLPVDLFDRDDINKIATGELVSIDNQIDLATGTVMLKARFDNQDESLFPNQFVNVRLRVVSGEPAVVIPVVAVQQGSKGAFVYVVNADNTVHVQPVVTGTVDEGRVAIVNGLEPGQVVVVEGIDRLREGARVEPINETASAPQADRTGP